MKISFIVIAYNEEKNIKTCINSILTQINLKNYEIIIVNDASSDKTSEIIKSLIKNEKNIHLIDLKKNGGRGNARFLGVNKAKGDYIAFIDADITLPKDWLKTCYINIEKFDATGGIAIPDGDVTYVYQKLFLKPKVVIHTSGITGSNSFFKKNIFKKVPINPRLRGGEDTDLMWRMQKSGFKSKLIKSLIVSHKENINYPRSIKRMFNFGKGATKLLIKHKNIRNADLSFFGFILILILGIINYRIFIIALFYPLVVSFLHLNSKFKFTWGLLSAYFINYTFILSYYLGRFVGFFKDE